IQFCEYVLIMFSMTTKPRRKPGRPRRFPHVLSLCVSGEIMEALERAKAAHRDKFSVSDFMRMALEAWLMSYGYLVPPNPYQPSQQSPNGGGQHGVFR